MATSVVLTFYHQPNDQALTSAYEQRLYAVGSNPSTSTPFKVIDLGKPPASGPAGDQLVVDVTAGWQGVPNTGTTYTIAALYAGGAAVSVPFQVTPVPGAPGGATITFTVTMP